MRTRRWLLRAAGTSAAATALYALSGSRVAVAQSEADSGTIRGQVTHGVSGAAQDAIEVQLWYLDATTRSRRLEQTVLTDAAGRFEFAGLGVAPADLYQPAVTFGGVEYVGPVVLAAGNANAAAAGQIAVGATDIEVFDVTHDPARVRLVRSNLILAQVNVAAGEVSLIQTVIVSNEGPQTYVAQPVTASPVRIAPPVGAVGVAPLTGGAARGHGGDGRWRFGTSHPVPAGRDAADDGLHPPLCRTTTRRHPAHPAAPSVSSVCSYRREACR